MSTPISRQATVAMEEHQEIRALIGSIEHLLDRAGAGEAFAGPLSDSLITLRERLKVHFSHEEEVPVEAHFSEEHPKTFQALRALEAQHPMFLTELDGLVNACSDGSVTGLIRRARGLLRDLRRHENAEHEALQGAFMDDIGAAD